MHLECKYDWLLFQRKNEKQKAFHAEVMANKDHVDSFKELVEG